MLIHSQDLDPSGAPTRIEIAGDETWLERIYSDFPAAGGARPRLTGTVSLSREAAGSVVVQGSIAFAPEVSCSRCSRFIPWPLRLELSQRYLAVELKHLPREKNLSRSDLDAYYLEDGAVDLETLINDAVQTELPSTFVPEREDGAACRVCKADLSAALVYGKKETQAGAPASPFAALKDLKLKR
jgi:uncharacterized metal-binding protein YceD (DUF177 family)